MHGRFSGVFHVNGNESTTAMLLKIISCIFEMSVFIYYLVFKWYLYKALFKNKRKRDAEHEQLNFLSESSEIET